VYGIVVVGVVGTVDGAVVGALVEWDVTVVVGAMDVVATGASIVRLTWAPGFPLVKSAHPAASLTAYVPGALLREVNMLSVPLNGGVPESG
jgi:hypothetical protein